MRFQPVTAAREMTKMCWTRPFRVALWLDIFIVILVAMMILLVNGARAETRDSVSQSQYQRDWAAINQHVDYDDHRLDDLESAVGRIQGIGIAIGAMAATSVGLKFRGVKKEG